jgi:hypothetical protein
MSSLLYPRAFFANLITDAMILKALQALAN